MMSEEAELQLLRMLEMRATAVCQFDGWCSDVDDDAGKAFDEFEKLLNVIQVLRRLDALGPLPVAHETGASHEPG